MFILVSVLEHSLQDLHSHITMEKLPHNPIIKYNPDTLSAVRKLYNLDQPGRIDEAINITEKWLMKQEHFTVKTFSRGYLERLIINNKGSLEACKRKLDRSCTFRTLMPHLYANLNLKEYDGYKMFTNSLIPTLTPDNERVILINCFGDKFEMDMLLRYYRFFILDGYCFRIKGLHVLSASKTMEYVVRFLKQVFNKKIGERIQIHSSLESIYKIFPKDILPVEYGGKEKSVPQLRDDFIKELGSEEFTKHCHEMKQARTNEELRMTAKFNEEYMGSPGTFRSLKVNKCLEY